MINAALDFITFLQSNFSFLFALVTYTILAVALSRSIKRHYKIYYTIFALLSLAFIIPFIFRLCGSPLSINLGQIPLFGPSINELSSASNFVHPVLIIIMYMGAFSPKSRYIGRLMSIRKELSIIVGFPVLAHGVKRLFASFPGGWSYFFDHEEYMSNPRVTSALGSGITSFVFVLGLVMFILFLVLWITSFDSVHRKLGTKRWKSVQRWSYGLYAMLFIHSIGLQLGGIISDNARAEQQQQRAQVEMVSHDAPQQGERMQQGERTQQGQQQPQATQGGHGHGRPRAFSFEQIKIERSTQRWIHIFVLLGIYGSYLYFRLRKARNNRAKRAKATM